MRHIGRIAVPKAASETLDDMPPLLRLKGVIVIYVLRFSGYSFLYGDLPDGIQI